MSWSDAEMVVRRDLMVRISNSVDGYLIENGITITGQCISCDALMGREEYSTFKECVSCWNKNYPHAKRNSRSFI